MSVANTTVLIGGRYRLDRLMTSGGSGETWQGTDVALARPVAVKLLRAELAEDPEALDRFRAGARRAAAVMDGGIARIYDYDETAAPHPPFLVTEFVDGPSLAAVLARGPQPPAWVLDVVAQAAAALHAVHRAGLVHGDVKPENVLLRRDGLVKLTDLGLSCAVGSTPVTGARTVQGAAEYLAPERATDASGTPAGDLYALGIVAYQCLASRLPFTGTPAELAEAHRTQPLPPLPASVPASVAALIGRLTAKDPANRPGSAAAVAGRAAALLDQLNQRDQPGRYDLPSRREQLSRQEQLNRRSQRNGHDRLNGHEQPSGRHQLSGRGQPNGHDRLGQHGQPSGTSQPNGHDRLGQHGQRSGTSQPNGHDRLGQREQRSGTGQPNGTGQLDGTGLAMILASGTGAGRPDEGAPTQEWQMRRQWQPGHRSALPGAVVAGIVAAAVVAVVAVVTGQPTRHAAAEPVNAATVRVNATRLRTETVAVARRHLHHLGLLVSVRWRTTARVPAGRVLSVQPAGRVPIGSRVVLVGARQPTAATPSRPPRAAKAHRHHSLRHHGAGHHGAGHYGGTPTRAPSPGPTGTPTPTPTPTSTPTPTATPTPTPTASISLTR